MTTQALRGVNIYSFLWRAFCLDSDKIFMARRNLRAELSKLGSTFLVAFKISLQISRPFFSIGLCSYC